MTTTSSPTVGSSKRAQEILSSLKKKRETLISNVPFSLQQHSKDSKPPSGTSSKKKKKSKRAAKDIRADMKKKRDALSTVLDSHKTAGAKRADRSIGLSTAPTGASTRSWLSHGSDDFSFCCSESEEESLNKFEIIVEIEDSDMNSLSTCEEVTRAIDTIYKQVIPHALSAFQVSRERSNKDQPTKSAVLSPFSNQKCLGDETLLDQMSAVIDRGRKKTKKKRKKTRRKSDPSKVKSDASESSSSAASSNDVSALRRQRSALKSMLTSVSELKAVVSEEVVHSLPQKILAPPRLRLRQDDFSAGSAPIESPRLSKSSKRMEFDLSKMQEKSQQPTQQQESVSASSSQVASHYVLETKVKFGRKKKIVVKPSSLYVATLAGATNMPQSEDDSLLVTPIHSEADESLLVSPAQESPTVNTPSPCPVSPPNRRIRTLNPLTPDSERSFPFEVFEDSKDGSSTLGFPSPHMRSSPIRKVRNFDPSTPDLSSEKSFCQEVFDDSNDQLDLPEIPILKPDLAEKFGRLAEAEQIQYKPSLATVLKPNFRSQTPEERRSGVDYSKRTFAKEDMMKEFNLLATKVGSKGLTIPTGTVITLKRHTNSGEKLLEEELSPSGWTFTEPSDLSTFSCTPALPAVLRAGADETCVTQPTRRRATVLTVGTKSDTQRFCGGLYHLAVLSGMDPCEEEI